MTVANDATARAAQRAKLRWLFVLFAAVNVAAAAGGALLAVMFRLNAPEVVAAVWKLGFVLTIYGVANIAIVIGIVRQVRRRSPL
jgi:hypothetical protein